MPKNRSLQRLQISHEGEAEHVIVGQHEESQMQQHDHRVDLPAGAGNDDRHLILANHVEVVRIRSLIAPEENLDELFE